MGKLTISTGPFSIAMLNYQRVPTNQMLFSMFKPSEVPLFHNKKCPFGDEFPNGRGTSLHRTSMN